MKQNYIIIYATLQMTNSSAFCIHTVFRVIHPKYCILRWSTLRRNAKINAGLVQNVSCRFNGKVYFTFSVFTNVEMYDTKSFLQQKALETFLETGCSSRETTIRNFLNTKGGRWIFMRRVSCMIWYTRWI